MGRSSSSFAALAVVFALGVAAWARSGGGSTPTSTSTSTSTPIPTSTSTSTPIPTSTSTPTPTPTPTSDQAAEEREAKRIDSLVALDRIGEAHTAALLFVQRHPSGPFSEHVMNLMGVHPRPPGAVPEPPEAKVGR